MAAPINAADLEKLKKFIEFVAANPFVLNLPQLEFMKKFIEKFGGKVPEGEFQMPSGGKCPFGGAGDATKSETKETEAEDEKPAEMDVESEESDVELDMEENSYEPALLQPNVVYLKEGPIKVVKSKPRKTKKISAKKKTAAVKVKCSQKVKNDDPLHTTVKEQIKIEEDEIKLEEDSNDDEKTLQQTQQEAPRAKMQFIENVDNKKDNNDVDENEDDDNDADADNDGDDYIFSADDSNYSDYDDEPLIQLIKGQRNKYDTDKCCRCRYQCDQKINDKQKSNIRRYFIALSKEDQATYVQQHTRERFVKYIRQTKTSKGIKMVFFLEEDATPSLTMQTKYETAAAAVAAEDDSKPPVSAAVTKVCRNFFAKILRLRSRILMDILKDYVPEKEKIHIEEKKKQENSTSTNPVITSTPVIKIKTEKIKTPKNKQYLDDETGNFVKKKKTPKQEKPPPPKRNPKVTNCAQRRCLFKCHERFSEQDRQQMCDFFWTLDYNRRKDFILQRIETVKPVTHLADELRTIKQHRSLQNRFYLRKSGENIRVCMKFIQATLAISAKVIRNAIEFADKSTGHYAGCDRRGLSSTHIAKEADRKYVMDQINSYPTYMPNKKTKMRFLHYNLSIKQMHEQYQVQAERDKQSRIFSAHFYRGLFRNEFQLAFLRNPNPTNIPSGFLSSNSTISHYTGEEKGGLWLDPYGNPLELSRHKPWHSFKSTLSNVPPISDVTSDDVGSSTDRNSADLQSQSAASASSSAATAATAAAAAAYASGLVLPDMSLQNVSSSSIQNSLSSLFRMF